MLKFQGSNGVFKTSLRRTGLSCVSRADVGMRYWRRHRSWSRHVSPVLVKCVHSSVMSSLECNFTFGVINCINFMLEWVISQNRKMCISRSLLSFTHGSLLEFKKWILRASLMAKKLLFQSWKLPFLPETLSKEIRPSDLAGLKKITQVLRWPLKLDPLSCS